MAPNSWDWGVNVAQIAKHCMLELLQNVQESLILLNAQQMSVALRMSTLLSHVRHSDGDKVSFCLIRTLTLWRRTEWIHVTFLYHSLITVLLKM